MSNLQSQETEVTKKRYLNTRECADLVLRTPEAVRRLAGTGKIPFRKPGGRFMFPLDEIQRWIDSGPGKTIDEINCQ